MPDYVQLTDLEGKIPPGFIIEALDDDEDGSSDPAAWAAVQKDGKTAIHGILAVKFAVPFESPVPDVVTHAACVFACEQLFLRRGKSGDANPWTKQADQVRAQLTAIAKGEMPLTPEIKRTAPSASVIAEPARTTSKTGKMMA